MASIDRNSAIAGVLVIFGTLSATLGCSSTEGPGGPDTVGVPGIHMAELNSSLTKLYLSSPDTNEVLVVDTRTLGVDTSREALANRAYVVSRDSSDLGVFDLRDLRSMDVKRNYAVLSRITVGAHPGHMSVSRDGSLLAVMDEQEGTGAVSFIDTATDLEVKRLAGFYTPHFMRFASDGRYGYVANKSAHHLTRVDLSSLEIDGHIPLEGFEGPPNATEAPDEGGFADAQIDSNGTLYAAHAATGRVLLYDTVARQKLPEIGVGQNPWIVFAQHPFGEVSRRYLGPNFGDRTISMIDGVARSVVSTLEGDSEAYGVNYSSQAPEKAFVMNRIREDVAVVDTVRGEIAARIPVGGNTETAATTPDGRWIVATVSSANRVAVIDAVTNEIAVAFDGVGQYPWSVTIPLGQNYCH